jgi:hypothetical protein
MPVGVLINLPGLTKEQYEAVTAKIFGQYPMQRDQAPQGLIMHTAGPAEGGWYVYDVWESREDFQRFGEERVGPAMQEVLGGSGSPPEPQFYDVSGFVAAY